MIRLIQWLLCLTTLLGGAISNAQSTKPRVDLDSLLDAFAQMEGLEAQFVEEKRLALLKAPLVSRGRLYFVRPGYLLRQIDTPQPSKVLITPTTLTLEDENTEETIDLAARSDVRSFVGSFVSLLAGDKDALMKVYRIELTWTESGQWRMELAPKAAPLSDLVTKVWVTGSQLAVVEVHVFDTSGDETITRMLNVNPKRQFNASERKALFGIEAS
ncbi:MAG: outer membrane lipoprotein carrier protein LolA [Polyangiales bacterium]